MSSSVQLDDRSRMLSHQRGRTELEESILKWKEKVTATGDLPHVTVSEQLSIIDALAEFPLGRFLLQNIGTDGFWTDYMIEHQHRGRKTGVDVDGRPLTPTEKTFLDTFPLVVATQQRAVIFTEILQAQVREGCTFGSVPCGMMRDLLRLNYQALQKFQLVGIDIDDEILAKALVLAEEYQLSEHVQLCQADAWSLPFENHFDVLTSSGLSMYEPDDDKVTALYRQFFKALRPGGLLLTSFLTPSPKDDADSEWIMAALDVNGIKQQSVLYQDIFGFNLKGLRSSALTQQQLATAGFEEIEIAWDKARVFPTVTARKPLTQ